MTPAMPPRIDLPTWDAEGGALSGVAVPPTAADAEMATDDDLLLRLGAALVREWNTLPMPTRRALYDRAVSGPAPAEDAALKRDMAIFLHDNKSPGPHS